MLTFHVFWSPFGHRGMVYVAMCWDGLAQQGYWFCYAFSKSLIAKLTATWRRFYTSSFFFPFGMLNVFCFQPQLWSYIGSLFPAPEIGWTFSCNTSVLNSALMTEELIWFFFHLVSLPSFVCNIFRMLKTNSIERWSKIKCNRIQLTDQLCCTPCGYLHLDVCFRVLCCLN